MLVYLCKRLALLLPTLLAIITLNFFIIQAAPGRPVERMLAQLENINAADSKGGFGAGGEVGTNMQGYKNTAITEQMREQIQKLYGFDKPIWERYVSMIASYLSFEFGESYYKQRQGWNLIIERLPV